MTHFLVAHSFNLCCVYEHKGIEKQITQCHLIRSLAVSSNPVPFFFLTFNYLMDLRSYYLSRFLFLIICSIVTDMKCQSQWD